MVFKPCFEPSGECHEAIPPSTVFHHRLDWLLRTGGVKPYPTADAAVADLGSESISFAILDNGKIESAVLTSNAYTTRHTLFQACSLSKPITGLAVMKLYEMGKLEIDAPITEYLDHTTLAAIRTPATEHQLQFVTVRQLLSQTAGLSVHGLHGYIQPAGGPSLDTALSGKAPSNTTQARVEARPGQTFAYSGGGFVILQLILEHVTGLEFPVLMRDIVLRPLGMQHSKVETPSPEECVNAPFTGYNPCDTTYKDFPERTAAGLWTTPVDILRAVRSLQIDLMGRPDFKHFLAQNTAKQMLRVVKSGMALSWMVPSPSKVAFGHTGDSEPGWKGMVLGFADIEHYVHGAAYKTPLPALSGVCILTNSAIGNRVYSKMVNAIYYLKGWPPQYDTEFYYSTPLADLKVIPHPAWKEWEGRWDGGWYLVKHISGNPCLEITNLPPILLVVAASPITLRNSQKPSIVFVSPGILGMSLRLSSFRGRRCLDFCTENGDGRPSLTRKFRV